MAREIHSISFQEDFVLWTETTLDDNVINIKRAVSDSLPVSINHQTVSQTTSIRQIANQLNAVMQKNELSGGPVRISIPGRFVMIKKVQVDPAVPANDLPELVAYEFEKIWDEPAKNYQVYLPEYSRRQNGYTEILGLAIRNNIYDFFENIVNETQLEVEKITPGCFAVDEFFRTATSEATGENLLLGWQRRGYDITISGASEFSGYEFRAYNSNLDSIEQIDGEELISGFDSLIDDIQQPAILKKPKYTLNSIYVYGFHFNPEWLDLLKAQIRIPIKLFNLENSGNFQLATESEEISADKTFQFIESISNIL